MSIPILIALYVDPCSFLTVFKTIAEDSNEGSNEDSEGFGCAVGSTATDSDRSDQLVGDVVSRDIDDMPLLKDHLDVEMRCLVKGSSILMDEYLMKGFRDLQWQ